MLRRAGRTARGLALAVMGLGLGVLALGRQAAPPGHAAPVLAGGAAAAQQPAARCQNPAPVIVGTGDGVSAALAAALQRLPGELAQAAAELPGLAVAVVLDQQVIFAAGFGCADIATGTGATPQTVYKIESVTKVFEATMAMQQRDAGKYQLTDTVDAYVPEVFYKLMDGQRYSPTFVELASHSSGLPDAVPNVMTLAQFWQALENTTATTAPGTYSYSDLGFVTLGQSVSIIAGQDYHDYVVANIFTPLGMTNSTYDYTPLVGTPALAIPYTGSAARGWQSAAPRGYVQAFPPAGDVFTTVEDMAKMVMLQFRTGPAGGDQILACTSIQEMWRPVVPTQGGAYATIGWFANPYGTQYTMISKNGGDPWWSTLVRFIPELRLGVVAFTNTGGQAGPIARIETTIFQALVPLLSADPPTCAS
jgi:CubicO group peptidase (beta-lactamase class C family)